jgi:hypothetical protein
LVTGTRPMRNAGTSTQWAGRSLSSENGSSAASTPSRNGPPGTSTEVPATAGWPGGNGWPVPSSGGPARSCRVCSIVSSCCCSWLTTMAKSKGRRRRRGTPAGRAPGRALLNRTPRPPPVAAVPGWRGGGRTRRRAPRRRPAAGPGDRRRHAAEQPEILLLADVREVPDQRAHQRAVLAQQLRLVVVGQLQRAVAGDGQLDGELLGQAAHWSTILVSTFSDRASMHPGCRQVTALLA